MRGRSGPGSPARRARGDRPVGQRVAAAVERTAGEDPEPCVAQREDLGPWLASARCRVILIASCRFLLVTGDTVPTGSDIRMSRTVAIHSPRSSRALPRRCEQMTVTIHDLRAWKTEGKRWAMLTAYDFPTAQILDRRRRPRAPGRRLRRAQRPRVRERAARSRWRRCSTTRAPSPVGSSTRWSSATCRSCRSRPRSRTASATPAA